jgi:hypothetical protein
MLLISDSMDTVTNQREGLPYSEGSEPDERA